MRRETSGGMLVVHGILILITGGLWLIVLVFYSHWFRDGELFHFKYDEEGRKGEQAERKQIGFKIDQDLWHKLRVLALTQNRTATELLEESMKEYLAKHGGLKK